VGNINRDGRDDIILFPAIRAEGETTLKIMLAQENGSFFPIRQRLQQNILADLANPGPICGDIDGDSRQERGESDDDPPNMLAIREQQHILGITQGETGQKVLLSLNTAGEVNAHSFIALRKQDKIVWFSWMKVMIRRPAPGNNETILR